MIGHFKSIITKPFWASLYCKNGSSLAAIVPARFNPDLGFLLVATVRRLWSLGIQ